MSPAGGSKNLDLWCCVCVHTPAINEGSVKQFNKSSLAFDSNLSASTSMHALTCDVMLIEVLYGIMRPCDWSYCRHVRGRMRT